MACKEMRLLAAILVATTAEAQTDGMVARYEIMTTSQFGLQKILFVYVHFNIPPNMQSRDMQANHYPAVCQHCIQPDHLAKPAWPQHAGAGGH